MTYPEVIKYLNSFINYERIHPYCYKKSIGLGRINAFLEFLGNPQGQAKFIHVAGTKGKGSTCIFIAYILKEAGYKIGLYTSPHLVDLRERIRVLPGKNESEFEGMISKGRLSKLVCELKPKIDEFNRRFSYGPLTFFEVYTAIALEYFKSQKVDFAVLETGLGGRLDATNAVNSLVAVITPISYEHMDKLGSTLRKIAGEKCGIIKGRELAVISAPQKAEVKRVLQQRCKKLKVRLYEVTSYKKIKLKLIGKHQLFNASVARKVIEVLNKEGIIKASKDVIVKGSSRAFWPARCEIIKRNPYIVLDGAQNSASVKVLRNTVEERFNYKSLILVLGVCQDKDIKGICSQLYPLAKKVILTRAENLRAMNPLMLAGYFKGKEIYTTNSVAKAKKLSLRLAQKNDLILVTGSLFVTGEFKYGRSKFN